MKLIDKDHMIYRLEQASKYFGGEQTDMFDERFSQGLKEASIKVAEELEIKAIPLSTLQEIRQEIINRIPTMITDGEFDEGIVHFGGEVIEIIDKHINQTESEGEI